MFIVCVVFLMMFLVTSVYGAGFIPPDKANINWKQFSGEKLNIMACSRRGIDTLKTLIPEFEALTGIKVTIDDYPEGEFFKKIVIDLSSGKPATDVFFLNHSFTVMYAEGGWIEPLKPFIDDPALTDAAWYDFKDYSTGSLRDCTYKDVLYGIPVAPDCQIMFYRKDVFQEKGVKIPETMDELLDLSKKLKTSDMAGIVLRLARGVGTSWPWNGYVQTYGGYWINPKTGEPELDSAPTLAATEMYLKLLKEAGPAGALNYSWYECTSDFQQGKAAIFGGDASIFVSNFEDKEQSKVAGKTGYAMLPAGPNGKRNPAAGTAWFWAMTAQSPKKKPAWLFIEWVTSKPTALKTGLGATEIMRDSIFKSEELAKMYPADWIQVSAETMSKYSEGYAFPMVKEIAPLMDIVDIALQKAFSGEMSTADALKEAQQKTLETLKKK